VTLGLFLEGREIDRPVGATFRSRVDEAATGWLVDAQSKDRANWSRGYMDPILTRYVREPNGYTLDFFLKHEGYQGLKKALGMQPNDIIEMVKASGLRGRGGAGFPT